MSLEFANFVDTVLVYPLSQILRNLNILTCEKLLNQVVYFSQRQFEDLLALKRWK